MPDFSQQDIQDAYELRGERFPLVVVGVPCPKCREPMALFRSSAGGFVMQRCARSSCPGYREPRTVSEAVHAELEVICPHCDCRMEPAVLPSKNYGYRCPSCGGSLNLADLLPE